MLHSLYTLNQEILGILINLNILYVSIIRNDFSHYFRLLLVSMCKITIILTRIYMDTSENLIYM